VCVRVCVCVCVTIDIKDYTVTVQHSECIPTKCSLLQFMHKGDCSSLYILDNKVPGKQHTAPH